MRRDLIYDTKEVANFIKCNNIGLLTSHNTHRIVSSYVPFAVVCEEKTKDHQLSLYCILKRKNNQWVSLQFNDLILVIFGSDALRSKQCTNPFFSLQVYGRTRLVDENELHEVSKLFYEQYGIEDCVLNLMGGFTKEYVGFEFFTHEIYGAVNPFYNSPFQERSEQALYDFIIKQII